MTGEALRTGLEAAAVVFVAAGLGLVVAALVGGLLGAGIGVLVCGMALLGAAEVSRIVHRGEAGGPS